MPSKAGWRGDSQELRARGVRSGVSGMRYLDRLAGVCVRCWGGGVYISGWMRKGSGEIPDLELIQISVFSPFWLAPPLPIF